jgi:nucleoside-diphosphate-sugar epimerase
MSRVLVTGARGFVGAHTLAPLLARGYEVHAVTSGPIPENAATTSGVVWHQADLLDTVQATHLIKRVRPTHLLHLAWVVTPGQFWTSPLNWPWVDASLKLLAAFSEHGGERAVMTGSCAEYDWQSGDGICDERSTLLMPATVYGACKAALAMTLPAFAAQWGIPSVAWARLFFMYGPGEQLARLVPSAIQTLRKGETFECTHGRQKRDFLYIRDAAEALVAVLESQATGPVNVGTGNPTSLHRLLSLIGAELGREDLLRFGARTISPDEPMLLAAATARLRDEVGWRPAYSLEDGVKQTVAWWQEQHER